MCLSTLAASSDRDLQQSLMLRVSTRISYLVLVTLDVDMTTQSKMETLSLEDWNDRETIHLLLDRMSGLRSSWLRLERSFTTYFAVINQELSQPASRVWRNMPTGTIEWTQNHIRMTTQCALTLQHTRLSMSGKLQTWRDGQTEVSTQSALSGLSGVERNYPYLFEGLVAKGAKHPLPCGLRPRGGPPPLCECKLIFVSKRPIIGGIWTQQIG